MSETEASRHDGPSERWVESIYRRWVVWSVLLLGVTLLSGWLALRVGVDNSVEIWFLEDDPALQSYREFQETFGNDEVVAIGVSRADGGDMLDAEGLRILQAVDDKSEAVEGIAHVDGVVDTPTVYVDGN